MSVARDLEKEEEHMHTRLATTGCDVEENNR